MENVKDIDWFKREMASYFNEYELIYKFFEQGDFGSLNQIEFNSEKIGGNIDLWGLGSIGIFVWDYEKNEEILNILLSPNQDKEKIEALDKLKELL
ncbi:hypothetical protein [Chryseobacterium sp. A321]